MSDRLNFFNLGLMWEREREEDSDFGNAANMTRSEPQTDRMPNQEGDEKQALDFGMLLMLHNNQMEDGFSAAGRESRLHH